MTSLLARGSGELPARLLVHIRMGARCRRTAAGAPAPGRQRSDVRHRSPLRPRRPVRGSAGRVDEAVRAVGHSLLPSRSRPASPRCTAGRSTSATPPRLASPIWAHPTSAIRCTVDSGEVPVVLGVRRDATGGRARGQTCHWPSSTPPATCSSPIDHTPNSTPRRSAMTVHDEQVSHHGARCIGCAKSGARSGDRQHRRVVRLRDLQRSRHLHRRQVLPVGQRHRRAAQHVRDLRGGVLHATDRRLLLRTAGGSDRPPTRAGDRDPVDVGARHSRSVWCRATTPSASAPH